LIYEQYHYRLRKPHWKPKLPGIYQWIKDGPDGQYHIGVIAQEVETIFNAEGLDAQKYGVIVHDEWVDDEGITRDRYGIKYDELSQFQVVGLSERLTNQE